MGVMKVLDPVLGDSRISWDSGKPHEVENARAQYDNLTEERGYFAYEVGRGGKPGVQLDEFDPSIEEMIMRPPMVAG